MKRATKTNLSADALQRQRTVQCLTSCKRKKWTDCMEMTCEIELHAISQQQSPNCTADAKYNILSHYWTKSINSNDMLWHVLISATQATRNINIEPLSAVVKMACEIYSIQTGVANYKHLWGNTMNLQTWKITSLSSLYVARNFTKVGVNVSGPLSRLSL